MLIDASPRSSSRDEAESEWEMHISDNKAFSPNILIIYSVHVRNVPF